MLPQLYYFISLPTAFAFFAYGVSCLVTPEMKREFERFRLPQFRVLIGITQLIGALGLSFALWFPLIGFLGASGLAFQMAAGLAVRIRIGDSKLQSSQAAVFLVLNLFLAFSFWREL